MARRRCFQEGSVFKRGTKRKVWVARWREQIVGEDGKPVLVRRAEVLGPVAELTKGDAKQRLQDKLDTKQKSCEVDSSVTFKGFIERWWKPSILPTYKPSTRIQAGLAIEKYLVPKFGACRLSEISRADVQAFFGGLLAKLKPDTVHGLHRYLRRILSSAIEWRFLSENPASRIKLPPTRRREPPFITGLQFQSLLRSLPIQVRLMVLLAMMTSMRIGEILGLRWGRVDLQSGIIRVSESCYRGQFSTVKTRKSERQIPMSPIVRVAMSKWKELRPGAPEDLVFATRNKKPLGDGNVLKRSIYPACDTLKIPRVSWHMFRHLHGTLLSQLGVPVAVAQAQLGHADPRITLAIYTHVLPDAQRDAVGLLERFLLDSNGLKLHQKRATAEMRSGRKLLAGLEKK
jgi:integrase